MSNLQKRKRQLIYFLTSLSYITFLVYIRDFPKKIYATANVNLLKNTNKIKKRNNNEISRRELLEYPLVVRQL